VPNADKHPGRPAEPPRRVTVEPGGPVVVQGPVEVVADDGTVAVSRRFAVAICTCRRSATYPWCDTSHRARERPAGHGRGKDGGGTR
jgi:CDGSH-type Zn-finger protein